MRDRNVGKVRIDDLYNLVIVIGQFLKLKIKLVVSSDELHFRRGASDDDELLGEDTFYNKSASIAGSVPGCNITTVRIFTDATCPCNWSCALLFHASTKGER
mgnify:CR=1 FL=1